MNAKRLKLGWRVVKFGDVVRQCKEKVDRNNNPFERYVEGGHMDTENIHIRHWGLFGGDYVGPAFHRVFRKGQVLYGSRRTYLKKVASAEFDGVTANTTFVLESKDPKVFIQDLLPFLMLTKRFTEHSIRESKGSTNPYINWPDIAKFEFPLPPLEEQKRIAEILWAADEAMGCYVECFENLASITNQYLRESFKHFSAEMVPCKQLFEQKPRNGISPRPNPHGKGFPTLSIGAVRDGKVNANGNMKYAEISKSDLNKFRISEGDIFVVRGNGNRKMCGKAGLVTEIPANCFYPDLLIKIVFDQNIILSEYAIAQWNHFAVHKKLLAFAKSTNGIWKISGKDLNQHRLIVPSMSVQEETVGRLKEIQKRAFFVNHHIENISNLAEQSRNQVLEGKADV